MNMMFLFTLFTLSMGENNNDTCSVAKNGTCSSAWTPVFEDPCQLSNNFTDCSSYSIQVPEDFYEEEVVPPSCSLSSTSFSTSIGITSSCSST